MHYAPAPWSMAHFYQMFLTLLEVGIFITLSKEKDTELLGTAKEGVGPQLKR